MAECRLIVSSNMTPVLRGTVPSFPEWQRNEGKVRKADGEDAFGREKFCFTKGKLSRQYMPTDPAALHQ